MNITRNIKKIPKQNFQTYQIHKNRTFNISIDYNVQSLYQILIKNPKLINEKDNKGETLLSYAIERDRNDIFDLILTSPILDLNYQNKEGNSYLHIAIQFEREKMIKSLIEKGINLNIQNNDGNTPLHIAHFIGNKKIINLLNDNNIDFTIKNNNGLIAEQNTQRNKKKSNLDFNSCLNSNSNNFDNVIIDNRDDSDSEINDSNKIEYNDISYVNKNRKSNVNLHKAHNSIDCFKIQQKFNKKKTENYTDDTKSNSPRNTNSIKIESNNDDVNLYSLTSSIEKQRKTNYDKINNNINNLTNQNYKYNKKYIIDEDDDMVNINPYSDLKRVTMKKHKTSILFNSKRNIINSNNYKDNIVYNKMYSDTIKMTKPILELDEDLTYISPFKEEYHLPYKRNTYNPNLNRDETKLKISTSQIPFINNTPDPLSLNNNNLKKIYNSDIININENINDNENKNTLLNNNTNYDNPLYQFLEKIHLEKYYKNLSMNGFDDINLIIEQTKNNELGITNDNLKEAGILSPGDRAKIIIKVQDLANNFSYLIPKEVYYTCNNLNDADSDKNILKLNNWLKSIGVENFLNNFISNGYHSLELLLTQIDCKEPLTLEKLKDELGIEKTGFRQRIINKLRYDNKRYKNKLENHLIIERKNEVCNNCGIF
jgi:hypothetical protein